MRRRNFCSPWGWRRKDRAAEEKRNDECEIIRPDAAGECQIQVIEEVREEPAETYATGTEAGRVCRRLRRGIRYEEADLERLYGMHAATYSLATRAAIAEEIEAARYRAGVLRRRAELLCPAAE